MCACYTPECEACAFVSTQGKLRKAKGKGSGLSKLHKGQGSASASAGPAAGAAGSSQVWAPTPDNLERKALCACCLPVCPLCEGRGKLGSLPIPKLPTECEYDGDSEESEESEETEDDYVIKTSDYEEESASPAPKRRRLHLRAKDDPTKFLRPLSAELEDDADFVDNDPDLLKMVQAATTEPALGLFQRRAEMDGIPKATHAFISQWDFWELWSGNANFTAAAKNAGMTTGPPVDMSYDPDGSMKYGPGWDAGQGLRLDLSDPADQGYVCYLLKTYKPLVVHCAPPCTFWCQLGRIQARRTKEEWQLRHQKAFGQLLFATRVLRYQHRMLRFGSLEQPPHCVSWRMKCVEAGRQGGVLAVGTLHPAQCSARSRMNSGV